MNECVKKEHVPSTNAATVGINPATGALAPSLREINFVLGNRERAAYEITKSKNCINVATKGDLFSALQKSRGHTRTISSMQTSYKPSSSSYYFRL